MPEAIQQDLMSGVESQRDGVMRNRRRLFAAGVCSLGGFIFGYDLGALAGATQGLLRAYHLSPAQFGLTVSISLWGAVCASPIAGRLADKLGRRGLLVACALAYGLTAVCLALPIHWLWEMLLALRLVSGASIAGFVVVCPLYLAEIAPRRIRGRYVGWFQLQIGIGVVVAFAVSAVLARFMPEAAEWKWCFGVGAIPPACLVALIGLVPEEPHWLASQGQWQKAKMSAERIGMLPADFAIESNAKPAQLPAATPPERLFQRKYVGPLLLATSAALFNQLCGVTILRVYLLDLLSGTGMGRTLSHSYGLLISCLNVFALLIGMTLVDRLGRRPLLIAGSAGMTVCFVTLTIALRSQAPACWYPVILVAYNTFFAVSQGAVTWVYLSEIFPFSVRGKGQGYGALVHWVANAGLIWIFPVMEHAMPRSCFLVFAFFMMVQVVVVLLWYPETKGTQLGAVTEQAA